MSTKLDQQQVIKAVYDEPNNALRVELNGSTPITVTIDQSTDSILVYGNDGTTNRKISTDSTGKLNINNISGTVSLPTGAATSANQTTANTTLSTINTTIASRPDSVSVPVISNVTISTPNVEQSFTIPSGTKAIFFRARGNSILKFAFVSGQSGTNYVTVSSNSLYSLT